MPNDERDDPDRDERTMRQRLEALIPDLVKRTFYAGLGAVFTTEEGIRKLANEMTLPKEVVNYLLSSASTTKNEVVRIIAEEVRKFLEKVNLQQEIAKMLTTLSFEIKTEIRFIPNDESLSGVKPDIKRSVAIKRADEKADDEPEE